MGEEIPVWVDGALQWLSGVDRKTTVRDVIELFIEGGAGGDVNNYEIIERWKQVERPLDFESRLLKIWTHWGDERKEVKLCLRRVDPENDSGRGSPVGNTPSLKRRRNRKTSKQAFGAEGLHPRRLAELGGFDPEEYQEYQVRRLEADHADYAVGEKTYVTTQEAGHIRRKHHQCPGTGALHSTAIEGKPKKCCSKRSKPKVRNSQNIEKLMKLILAQGATIQNQLQKLKDREEQIEDIEVERHKERAEKNGRNYLLETYLKSLKEAEVPVTDEEKGNDSGVHTEAGSEQTNNEKETTNATNCSGADRVRSRHRFQDNSNERPARSKSETRTSQVEAKVPLTRTLSESTVCDKGDEGEPETKENADEIVELRRVQSQVEMWEKVLKINKKLEKEEENLVKLHIQIRRIQSENIKYARAESPRDPITESMQNQLESLRTDLDQNSKEIYGNFTKLIEDDEQVVKKQNYLTELIADLEKADHDHQLLAEMVSNTSDNPPVLPADIGISLQVKGQEITPDLIPCTSQAELPLPDPSDSQRDHTKPKIHKISFVDTIQSDDTPEKANPSPVPTRNLKSILKNRQSDTFYVGDLAKVPVNYGSNISTEEVPKLGKTTLRDTPERSPGDGCNNPLYSNPRATTSFTAAMENPYEHLFPQQAHRREAIYQPGSPPAPAFPPQVQNHAQHEATTNFQTSIYYGARRMCHPPAVVTTRAIVHDTDSSGSSDTSGLSSMYSASPTADEPYVLNTLV